MGLRYKASHSPKITPQSNKAPHIAPVQTLMAQLTGGSHEEWDEMEFRRWQLWELVEIGEADNIGEASIAFRRLTAGGLRSSRGSQELEDPFGPAGDIIPGTRIRDL